MDEIKMLAYSLTEFIKDKHTQDECLGFIEGYKKAFEDINNSKI